MSREPKPIDWRALAKTFSPRTQAFIDGRYVPAISGATFDCVNPANGQVIAKVASCDAADVELRGRGRTQGVRCGPLVAPRSCRAQEGAAALRGADPQAPRGARAHRDERHGQAHLGLDEDRHPGGRELHRLVWRSGRQGLRRGRANLARFAGPDHARARGCRRCDRALELSAADGVLEARPGARNRQFRRTEALGEVAAHGAAHRGARDGGGPARGRSERRAGLRQHGRRGARACTWTSTASPSPAPPAPASGCSSTRASRT